MAGGEEYLCIQILIHLVPSASKYSTDVVASISKSFYYDSVEI